MASKAIVLFGLLLATVLLISSEVAARDLAETTNTIDASKETEETNENAINDAKDGGGYGGYPGDRYGGGRGGSGHGGVGGGQGGYCSFGRCCGLYGCRCCNFAGENVNVEPQGKPQN